ncbi:hypothetical protein LOTGIDRAFT_158325 [Lottia gigantea]|uniref:Sema domain-containing protein n=1 Tax=Lottia gigantea TaxID=225164 RepID=V4CDS3_LOTGI|nr:hypothetical protein LOTGIDRAFT_158325 [Lottia gigantea]ESP00095.1 hypothetical protein LOTGIDRAFT_158325 [Lottia gigantea]
MCGAQSNPKSKSLQSRLYWISNHSYGCTIESSDLNGRERQILTVVRDSQIFDLDILHNIILMSDVRNNRLYLYNVLEGRNGKTVSKDWGGKPLGLKVFSRERQYYIGENLLTFTVAILN